MKNFVVIKNKHYLKNPLARNSMMSGKWFFILNGIANNSYTNMTNTTLVSFFVRDVSAMPTAVDTTARSTGRSLMK